VAHLGILRSEPGEAGSRATGFDALFHRVYPSLHRYLLRLTGDADAAEDAAQEAFVRLLERPIPEDEARAWLFTVALNLVRDGARRSARRRELLTVTPVSAAAPETPEEVTERSERIESVRRALDRVPERDRQLLLMREEGFTYEEIARVVGVAPGSVGTLVGRALRRFADVYKNLESGRYDDSSG
jgi:RNA polymerase sigma-70 factor, ECF subfamily